jgi:enoyl-CoA hydratase/carnithine racemase
MNENTAALFAGNRTTLSDYAAEHFGWSVTSGVGTITLNRPERKNPLTFESYAELRDLFRQLAYATDVHVIVIYGAGGNFCSGGDVHDIIAPLVDLPMPELLMFTRMTGDLVKAMRHCPQPVIAAVDGVCAGAGAIMAMASDMRLGTARSKLAFLFTRVGLAGCDGHLTCSLRDARRAVTKGWPGVSTTACASRTILSALRTRLLMTLLPDRRSRTASPRRCCIRNGA